MAAPTSALLTKYIAQYRALGLRCLLTFAGLALAALLILGPSDGRPPRDEKAVAAQPSPTRSPRPTTTRSPAATPTRAPRTPGSTNAPEAAPDPGPGPADAGGDQPSAPLPPVYGGIPENVNASPEFLGLKDQLAAEIAAYDAADHIDVSVAVTDLQTGETISVNGNDAHRTGCTIMMFALLAAVNEFQAGHGDPAAEAYHIRRGIGGSYPPEVRYLLDDMFGSYYSGTLQARQLMAGWGMHTSYFDHLPYYGSSDDPPPNILTALEENDIFVRLYRGQLFNADWTAYTLQKLTEIAPYLQYILPGRLPSTATVTHKIGYYADNDGWVNNDAGVVTFPGTDGTTKAYAITYFSQQGSTEYQGYSFGARISRIVWDYMAPKYAPPPTPAPTDTPVPTPGPTPITTPPPTPVPTPTASATATPVATPTPAPSPSGTPGPTKTPKP